METKHTKAPDNRTWEVTPSFMAPDKVMVHAHPKRIALCYNKGKSIYPSREEAEANAKLIAAAPELLEALKKINEFAQISDDRFAQYSDQIHEISLAAIKKATE